MMKTVMETGKKYNVIVDPDGNFDEGEIVIATENSDEHHGCSFCIPADMYIPGLEWGKYDDDTRSYIWSLCDESVEEA